MTYSFRLPDIGEGTAEAEIAKWHVAPGDIVAEDQLLVDVMTDKATVEMTSPIAGRVIAIHGGAGELIPVGSLLVELMPEGEAGDEPASVVATPTMQVTPKKNDAVVADQRDEKPVDELPVANASKPAAPDKAARALASPAVRREAYERGIPLQFIRGSGDDGRVLRSDLDRYGASAGLPMSEAAPEANTIRETKIVGLRRRIAEKMQESKRQIPHFAYVEEFDLTELERLRGELNATRSEGEPKLTLLPFFMRAIVRLVKEFPDINSRFDDANGVLSSYDVVHIGIATQTPNGLMVPVVRDAQRLDIWQSAAELARVTTAARDGTANRETLSGSTITLTSLGALGGLAATPIINYPEVAIIGPNKLVERPVVLNGQIVIRKMMNVSSSFDHRIVDGYDAARFIQGMKRLIECPSLLFVERKA